MYLLANREGLSSHFIAIGIIAVLLVLLCAGPALAGWDTKREGTYDGCQYGFYYGWWYTAASRAETEDYNGGCQYQYVKGWDSDESHIHGYTTANPAHISFSVRDSDPNTVKWQVKTWEHGWYATLQLGGQSG